MGSFSGGIEIIRNGLLFIIKLLTTNVAFAIYIILLSLIGFFIMVYLFNIFDTYQMRKTRKERSKYMEELKLKQEHEVKK